MRTKGRSKVKGRRKRKNEKEGNKGKRRRKGEGKARRAPEGFQSLLVTVIILPDVIYYRCVYGTHISTLCPEFMLLNLLSYFFDNCMYLSHFFPFLPSFTSCPFCLLLQYDLIFFSLTDVIMSLLSSLFFLFFCTKFGKPWQSNPCA